MFRRVADSVEPGRVLAGRVGYAGFWVEGGGNCHRACSSFQIQLGARFSHRKRLLRGFWKSSGGVFRLNRQGLSSLDLRTSCIILRIGAALALRKHSAPISACELTPISAHLRILQVHFSSGSSFFAVVYRHLQALVNGQLRLTSLQRGRQVEEPIS